MLKGRCRYAGRQHEADVKQAAFGVFDHETDALGSQYIGNLMGIGNDGPRAFRDNEIAEMRRREHRAFDMHVRVNKRRKNGFSGEIDDFSGFDAARGNKTRDAVTSYEHVDSRKPHAVKNIGRYGPGETKIRQAGGKARLEVADGGGEGVGHGGVLGKAGADAGGWFFCWCGRGCRLKNRRLPMLMRVYAV